jgi:hypothetical protein
MVMGVLAGALAAGACGGGDEAGVGGEPDQAEGIPEGAVPAPEGSAANTEAAGVPLDSAGAGTAGVDSVTPELGR